MKQKNAKRQHFIAPYTTDDAKPSEKDYLRFAHQIQTIEDDSDEDTDDFGDYAGDGTAQTILNGRKEVWNFEGFYDPEDPAHQLLASLRRKTNDDDRKIWHKIIETNGDTVEGVAKAMEIKAGGGDATDYEDFEGHLDYVSTPDVTPKADAPVKVTGATITPVTASVEVGKTAKLSVTVAPTNATDSTGKWAVADNTVATIATDGTVTGVKAGSTQATFTTTDGGKTASATITVTAAA